MILYIYTYSNTRTLFNYIYICACVTKSIYIISHNICFKNINYCISISYVSNLYTEIISINFNISPSTPLPLAIILGSAYMQLLAGLALAIDGKPDW